MHLPNKLFIDYPCARIWIKEDLERRRRVGILWKMWSVVVAFVAGSCVILAAGFILEVAVESCIVTQNENGSPPPPQSTAGVNSSGIPWTFITFEDKRGICDD